MIRGFFITGTDTGVGKTRVACTLLELLQGTPDRRAIGMKPVASGAIETPQGWRNGDALALQSAANVKAAYDDINPYLFRAPTAPHLAAASEGSAISADVIAARFDRLAAAADLVVVEGAGGWFTPIGPGRTMADVAQRLGLPVILVVGLRLGCLNHALLTSEAIARSGLVLAGWVQNRLAPDPDGILDGYPLALAERIPAPCLATLCHEPAGAPLARAAASFDPRLVEAILLSAAV